VRPALTTQTLNLKKISRSANRELLHRKILDSRLFKNSYGYWLAAMDK
jgi:hypothetical protein